MIFTETKLPGAYVIEPERLEDDRGFFARTWCHREFSEHGLQVSWAQSSVSCTKVKGSMRGLHYQAPPYQEIKLVRCTRGSIHDVIVDLRPDSPTFMRHAASTLSATNFLVHYIPRGFAHGFQTLEDDSEVVYLMSEFYHPEASRGVRWNDSAFGIQWPLPVTVISDRDRTYPDFSAEGATVWG